MEHLTRITQMPGTMGGKACICGMRVTVGITVDPNRTRLRVLPLMSKQNAQKLSFVCIKHQRGRNKHACAPTFEPG